MVSISNWFACSICREPTVWLWTGQDGKHYGRCKSCRRMVPLQVDYEGNSDWQGGCHERDVEECVAVLPSR